LEERLSYFNLREILERSDIYSVYPKQIRTLINYSKTEEGKKSLLALANNEDLLEEFLKQRVSLLFLMKSYDVKLPFALFLQIVPVIKPRLYSISSSLKVSKTEVKIIYTILRDGLCTNYLAKLEPDDKISAVIIPSGSKYPDFMTKNIVSVVSGAGLSFIMGAIEERHLRKDVFSSTFDVYMPCKNKASVVKKKTFQKLKNSGAVTSLTIADSSENENILEMLSDQKDLVSLLEDKNTFILVCGSSRLIDEVYHLFISALMESKKISKYAALLYINQLKAEHKNIEDIKLKKK